MWLSTLTYAQREAMLRLAHNVIVSDGLLDPNEEGMLEAFRREMAVSADFEVEYVDIDGIEQVFPERQGPHMCSLRSAQLLNRSCQALGQPYPMLRVPHDQYVAG